MVRNSLSYMLEMVTLIPTLVLSMPRLGRQAAGSTLVKLATKLGPIHCILLELVVRQQMWLKNTLVVLSTLLMIKELGRWHGFLVTVTTMKIILSKSFLGFTW